VSKCWTIPTESVTVTVDGTVVTDPLDGTVMPAVVVTMPGFVAHSLAHCLTNWSRCVELTRGEGGERVLAALLHVAARHTNLAEVVRCEEDPDLPVDAVLINT